MSFIGRYNPYSDYSTGDIVSSGSAIFRALGPVSALTPPAMLDLGPYGSGSPATYNPSWPVGVNDGDLVMFVHWRPSSATTGFTMGGVSQPQHSRFLVNSSFSHHTYFVVADTAKTLAFATTSFGWVFAVNFGPVTLDASGINDTAGNLTTSGTAHAAGSHIAIVIGGGASGSTFTLTGGTINSITTGSVRTGLTAAITSFTATWTRTSGAGGYASHVLNLDDPDLTSDPNWAQITHLPIIPDSGQVWPLSGAAVLI